eukprot:TRINITY_DN4995_c0_g1_i1.p2 TRINITY_DN4995_c0_g1~~TRINITY_DN4995_c0_g1_i1.p2  ORF type:complete len:51 (+),score=27.02 TRINITY_DN4995_c0_g1_i1:152-304(+)
MILKHCKLRLQKIKLSLRKQKRGSLLYLKNKKKKYRLRGRSSENAKAHRG